MFKRTVLPGTQLFLALILAGCGAFFPKPLPTPFPPEMIGTAIVQTEAAIIAETAANAPSPSNTPRPSRTPQPSETPRPTWTPTTSPSPTVTFVITIPAIGNYPGGPNPTLTSSGSNHTYAPLQDYKAANGCDLVGLAPTMGAEFSKGDNFDAEWTFANYGPLVWDATDVDFKYIDGEKMQKFGDLYDLPSTIFPGERIKVIVDMTAPSTAGSYSSTWMLTHGDRLLCQVSISIVVK